MNNHYSTSVLCFWKNQIVLKFQKAVTKSILDLGPWSMDQND